MKAEELAQMDEMRTMDKDWTGTTHERSELREAGYYHTAKLIVLRDLWLQKKGLPTTEEE